MHQQGRNSGTIDPKKAKFQKKRTQDDFRQALETYYGVLRKEVDGEIGQMLVYCSVTQVWWLSGDVRAAHIVPKSLQSEELP